ncbi:hypothetical protein ABZP36_023658, partial [Zizania latifolia]
DPNWSAASDDFAGCCSADSLGGPLCKQEHVNYPERPGRPECPFYMRFGDCKFASACKFGKCKYLPACMFHHPKDRLSSGWHPSETVVKQEEQREQTLFPERPGEPECFYYMKHGSCRFQRNCKYHHLKDRLSKKSYDLTFD